MMGTLARICRTGILIYFILISYIAMTSSMTLDLTELRNKVSKIKVNPRGNLWATGHFMGKKSVDRSLFEDLDIPSHVKALIFVNNSEELRDQLIQAMKMAVLAQHKNGLDIEQDPA